jgi:epoxyqueuosine reductase
MPAPVETAKLLKQWALDCGFDRAGVAAIRESEHREALLAWLDLGRHAGMGYLARRVECRLDPRNLVPWARSVLCVALQYANGDDGAEGDLWPRVARYARGKDYHDVMGSSLAALSARIEEEFPGASTRWYVDTGPVLERELAARAGLGAIGKNTNLLHPEAGSYFFLGEIFLDLDLEPDIPLADLCGSCTACLEACPTGALPEPFVLDASRCISYWNIEHRGSVPATVRDLQGDWVFGCDVCQEVCPWNVDPQTRPDPDFDLPQERGRLGLIDLLLLTTDDYVRIFRRSPMKRAKLDGLKRDAAIAIGNRRGSKYVEALSQALVGEATAVREQAAWALGEIGGEAAVEGLRLGLASELDDGVRSEIRAALGRQESGSGGPALC